MSCSSTSRLLADSASTAASAPVRSAQATPGSAAPAGPVAPVAPADQTPASAQAPTTPDAAAAGEDDVALAAPADELYIEIPAIPEIPPAAEPAEAVAPDVASELTAPRVRYSGNSVIAEGGVVYRSGETTVRADRVQLDTADGQITALGNVLVERLTTTQAREIGPKSLPTRTRTETFLETLRGENFSYNTKTGKGNLDNAVLALPNFSVTSRNIIINGRRYEATDVVLRLGPSSPEDIKTYGRSPFSIRARKLVVEPGTAKAAKREGLSNPTLPGSAAAGGDTATPATSGLRVAASGAAFYIGNRKILPIPSYVLRQAAGGSGAREDSPYQITPRVSFNSTDSVLLTTKFRFPISKDPLGPSLLADLGLSAKIGVRGGATLQYPTKFGSFLFRGRKNDIVTTQLTNRIVLDRTPEVVYALPTVKLLSLPGGRSARLGVNVSTGRFNERLIGEGSGGDVRANRSTLDIVATTRSNDMDGPYLELFALNSRYSNFQPRYRTTGFEVGYYGNVGKHIRGLFSYRASDVNGNTPFRFDRVEIARELRTTFDVFVTPRYIVPIDLRYDLDLNRLRDTRFGLLRNYKTFAYGLSYQTARRELKLEFRQGF